MKKTNRLCIKCIPENKNILKCDRLDDNEQDDCFYRTGKGYCTFPMISYEYKDITDFIDKLGEIEEAQEQCKIHNLTMCENCINNYYCDEETIKENLVNVIINHKKCDKYKNRAYCCYCGVKLN